MPALFLLGYIIGSIPFGFVLSKLAGHGDIRNIGSGNIGATNVLRTGNKALAALTLLLDAGKGAAVIFVLFGFPHTLFADASDPDTRMYALALLTGFGAIIGHCFPFWLKFKGGKGVATTIGVLLAATPATGLAACFFWLMSAFAFRISSLAALIAMGFAAPITFFVYGAKPAGMVFVIALTVYIRHKDNIKRLLKGEEPKIGNKKDEQTASSD